MIAFRLTAEQMALLPSDADVAHYEQRGYYVSREGAIPESLLERAIRGVEHVEAPVHPSGNCNTPFECHGNGCSRAVICAETQGRC